MKAILPIVFALVFVISSFADDATSTNSSPQVSTNQPAPAPINLSVADAKLTAPLVLTNGYIWQPEQTELPQGGKAVFSFTVARAGSYIIKAMVNAPGEDQNSFFINMDAAPDDTMIWDMDPTSAFEERTVSWRGNGDANSDEISPKKFTLSAGAHKLFIVGREPTELKSISITKAD